MKIISVPKRQMQIIGGTGGNKKMKGRLETRLKTEGTIQKQLSDSPKYLQDYAYNLASSKEPKTVLEYVRKIKLFLSFLNEDYEQIDISKVTDLDISRYIASREVKRVKVKNKKTGKVEERVSATSSSYLKGTHTVLMGFFSYLQLKGYIDTNPVKMVQRIRREDSVKRRRFKEDDLRKIMESVESLNKEGSYIKCRDEAIIMLLINTGMRETALTEINVEDINFSENKLTIIDKRHTTHEYYLNDMLSSILRNYIEKRKEYLGEENQMDALFISQKKNRIHPNSIADLVKKYTLNSLGAALSPHKLRAAFCTILYEKTKDIEFVRDVVGHKSSSTTRKYIVKDGTERMKASNMMADIFKQ